MQGRRFANAARAGNRDMPWVNDRLQLAIASGEPSRFIDPAYSA